MFKKNQYLEARNGSFLEIWTQLYEIFFQAVILSNKKVYVYESLQREYSTSIHHNIEDRAQCLKVVSLQEYFSQINLYKINFIVISQAQVNSLSNQQNLTYNIINFKQKRNEKMGNNKSTDQKVQDHQQFQSLKTTYRSSKEGYPYQNVQLEAITFQKKYIKWNKEMNNYLRLLSQKLCFSSEQIHRRFWMPISMDFVSNQSNCKEKIGRAVLTFKGGYKNLTQEVIQRSFNNNPFTNTQLWYLLYYFTESLILYRKSLPNFQLHSNKIMVNNDISNVKFFFPFTQFQPFIPVRTEPYISNQKLIRKNRKISSQLDIEKRNDDFIIGLILAQCILLQSCSQIYELGQQGKKYFNQQILEQIINRVLKISYYPIKLKLIIVGLIQFDEKDRFSLNDVSQLLQSHKNKIQNFQNFHTTKTEFTNSFGSKLQKIQLSINKLKLQVSQQMFQKGLTTINRNKPIKSITVTQITQSKIKAPFSTKDNFFPVDNHTNKTQSLNFSLSQIPKVAQKDDESMSLVWSKSQLKSNRQQCAFSGAYSPRLSPHLKQISNKQQEEKKSNKFAKVKEESLKIENFDKQNVYKELVIVDQFDPFKKYNSLKDEASEKSQDLNQQPISFTLKKTQSLIKEQEIDQPKHTKSKISAIERAYSEPFKSQAQKKSVESQNFKLDQSFQDFEVDKKAQEIEQNELIGSKNIQFVTNDSKPKIPLVRKLSQMKQQNKLKESSYFPSNNERLKSNQDSLSEVVEYKSYLYEIPNQMSPISYKQQDKNPQMIKEKQNNEAKKQDSDESPIRRNQLNLQNFSSPDRRPQSRRLKQTDSIIIGLTNLLSTKKIDLTESQGPKQSTIISTQTKVAQYMKSFTKFSPELIAQLNIRSNYPQDQKLKLKARESLNTNKLIMSQSRELFPLTEYPLHSEQNAGL